MPVYFIQCGEGAPVKIGIADDVAHRLAELQTAHHTELTVIRTLDGDRIAERRLHAHYRASHIRGEWFGFCPTMLTITLADVAELAIRLVRPARAARPESTAGAIIRALGGPRVVAAALGVPANTALYWTRDGRSIPSRHWRGIVSMPAAEQAGITIMTLAEALAAAQGRGSAPTQAEAA